MAIVLLAKDFPKSAGEFWDWMNMAKAIENIAEQSGAHEMPLSFNLGTSRRGFIASALLSIGVAGVPLSACNAKNTSGGGPFFKPAHFAILDAVTETIMPRTDTPGARDVQVAKRIDTLMMGWASPQTQINFTRILDEIDATAKGIAAIPPAKQLEIVAAYDKAKMRDPAYGKFKNLIFALYYLSEPGATQELRYEHVPGAWEPSIPVTADTRGYAFDINI
jgi:gluconate 2-dehydrogenase gamma chain